MSSLTNPSWPERYHVYAKGLSLTETPGAGNILALNNRNEVVRVPGTAEVDLTDYYTKEEIDESTYEKEEVDQMLWVKADKSVVDAQLSLKADSMNVHTKNESAVLLAMKADKSTTYTKTQVDNALAPKAVKTEVTSALALKADKTDVDEQLSLKADKSNVHTKGESIIIFAQRTHVYPKSETYSQVEVNQLLATRATNTALTNGLAIKADKSDTYTKAQVDALIPPSAKAVGGFIPTENNNEIQNMIICNDYSKVIDETLRTGTRLYQAPTGSSIRVQSNTVIGEKNLNGGKGEDVAKSNLRFNVVMGNRILKENEHNTERNVLLGTDICNFAVESNGTSGKQNDNVIVGSEIMKTWGAASPYSFSENIVIGSRINQTVGSTRGIDNCIIIGRNVNLPANDEEKLKDAIIIGGTQKQCMIKSIYDNVDDEGSLVYVKTDGTLTRGGMVGSQNTFLGGLTGRSERDDSVGNTCIGYRANGTGLGNRSTFVGAHAGVFGDEVVERALCLGHASTVTGSNAISIDATNVPENTIALGRSVHTKLICPAAYKPSAGSNIKDLQIADNGAIGYKTSARRFKQNIEDLGDDYVESYFNLRPAQYNRLDSTEVELGLIAEEVEEVCPDLAFRVDGEIMGVNYGQLHAMHIAANKKLKRENDELRDLVSSLVARVEALESK